MLHSFITTRIGPVADNVYSDASGSEKKEVRTPELMDDLSRRTKLTQTSGARYLNGHSQEKEEAQFVDVRSTPLAC